MYFRVLSICRFRLRGGLAVPAVFPDERLRIRPAVVAFAKLLRRHIAYDPRHRDRNCDRSTMVLKEKCAPFTLDDSCQDLFAIHAGLKPLPDSGVNPADGEVQMSGISAILPGEASPN